MQVLFCDIDDITKDYLQKHPAPNGVEYVMFEKSLNDMSDDELCKYYESVDIISTFVYSRLDADLLAKFKNLKIFL